MSAIGGGFIRSTQHAASGSISQLTESHARYSTLAWLLLGLPLSLPCSRCSQQTARDPRVLALSRAGHLPVPMDAAHSLHISLENGNEGRRRLCPRLYPPPSTPARPRFSRVGRRTRLRDSIAAWRESGCTQPDTAPVGIAAPCGRRVPTSFRWPAGTRGSGRHWRPRRCRPPGTPSARRPGSQHRRLPRGSRRRP